MYTLFGILAGVYLAVSSWIQPQPQLSSGLLVVYGGQQLIQANADWHSYSLEPTHGCGLASISPAMLGKLAWVSVDGKTWLGPCLVVDVQGRNDALDSIFRRKEVAEISRDVAAQLGFKYGANGYIYFGNCPIFDSPQPYRPPYVLDAPPLDWTPSFYPYPQPEIPAKCGPTAAPGYPLDAPKRPRQAFLDEKGYSITP